jgi:hypothetical protein
MGKRCFALAFLFVAGKMDCFASLAMTGRVLAMTGGGVGVVEDWTWF